MIERVRGGDLPNRLVGTLKAEKYSEGKKMSRPLRLSHLDESEDGIPGFPLNIGTVRPTRWWREFLALWYEGGRPADRF